METYCCVSCFQDPFIRDVVKSNSTGIGKCEYCGSYPRRLISVDELAGYFHTLVRMYEQTDYGSALIEAIQCEWQVFSDKLYEASEAGDLLEAILNSDWDDDDAEFPISVLDTYSRRAVMHEVETWEEFRESVLENPAATPDFGGYFEEELAVAGRSIEASTILYRARLGWVSDDDRRRKQPYRGVEIGAPPSAKASAGRANRKGRPVLYCAESEETAIAEVRPVRGYWVSTCKRRANRDLRILDLVDGIPAAHPFTDETLAWSVEFPELVQSFAEALSAPLARSDDTNNYLPSQKLCEYAEGLRFDGVRYSSAMNDEGVNLVLFDPSVVEILDSALVEVVSVKVSYRNRPLPPVEELTAN
jgi:hypothetical protein